MNLISTSGGSVDLVRREESKEDIRQVAKPKKDIFRPYCLKDPDIKPFKLSYNFKVDISQKKLN